MHVYAHTSRDQNWVDMQHALRNQGILTNFGWKTSEKNVWEINAMWENTIKMNIRETVMNLTGLAQDRVQW